MRNFLFVVIIFILSYWGISSLGAWIFPSVDENSATTASSLQAAVTFGGINYLNVFIYIILAMIVTAILFFSAKNKLSK